MNMLEIMARLPTLDNVRIGVIGLGYVGLPLAVYIARHFPVIGFDVNERRVAELACGIDRTQSATEEEFRDARALRFSTDPEQLRSCNFYIVSVPTPVDDSKRPDFTALEKASATVGGVIGHGDVVVFESTVYPGATEEICVPIIERTSGLRFNFDFFAGYSPERINPGDPEHRLPAIVKITSGSTPAAADLIDSVYSRVITAGTHRVSSIQVAEAAKVIENIQRDANIALVNELAMLFKKLGINTREILEASGTKWNFHRYSPGLVGGHCIGVDPYYLTHKAQSVGFHPEMILAGRRINDSMPSYIAQDVIRMMLKHGLAIGNACLLVMGFTFKENCPDTRNTKVAGLVKELEEFVGEVQVYDPLADPEEADREYGIRLLNALPNRTFDAIVLAVKHNELLAYTSERLKALLNPGGLIYDVKGVLPVGESHGGI